MMLASTMSGPKGTAVGRKRRPPKGRARTLQQKFARNLHQLAGDKTNAEIAEACGVSAMAVSKWFAGLTVPEIALWPTLAKCFGVEVKRLMPPDA